MHEEQKRRLAKAVLFVAALAVIAFSTTVTAKARNPRLAKQRDSIQNIEKVRMELLAVVDESNVELIRLYFRDPSPSLVDSTLSSVNKRLCDSYTEVLAMRGLLSATFDQWDRAGVVRAKGEEIFRARNEELTQELGQLIVMPDSEREKLVVAKEDNRCDDMLDLRYRDGLIMTYTDLLQHSNVPRPTISPKLEEILLAFYKNDMREFFRTDTANIPSHELERIYPSLYWFTLEQLKGS